MKNVIPARQNHPAQADTRKSGLETILRSADLTRRDGTLTRGGSPTH